MNFLILTLCILALALVNSFYIIGLNEAAKKPYILADLAMTLRRKLPGWLFDPLIGCPFCMASIHGGGTWIVFWSFFGSLFGAYWPAGYLVVIIYIPMVSGMVRFMYVIHDLLMKVRNLVVTIMVKGSFSGGGEAMARDEKILDTIMVLRAEVRELKNKIDGVEHGIQEDSKEDRLRPKP